MPYHLRLAIPFLLLIILILASLFSFAETATVAVSEHRLKTLQKKYFWASCAYKLKLQLNRVLIFSLFGNSLFNAIFTTVSTVMIENLLSQMFYQGLILPVTTFIIALIIIIFSEAVPKIIAARMPVAVLKILAIPLYYLFQISKPIIWFIDKIIFLVSALIKNPVSENQSLDELRSIIADERSPLKGKHKSILLNSIDLEDICVKEVLIPLRMIEAVNISGDMTQTYRRIYTTHHTRIIVFDKNIDNIIGYVNAKDVLSLKQNKFTAKELIQVVRPITYVHDFVPIVKQIHRSQKQRARIFTVINEYGDLLGIACLEDMLEIIFGNFTTESPQQKQMVARRAKNELIVDGSMLIRELNERYGLKISFGIDSFTVNGLVLKLFNGIPNAGVCFRIKNLIIEVMSVGEYWVERVKITIL